MKFFLIEPRGFCFGVTNALEIVEEVIRKYPDKKIFVYNEIVHNKVIVEELIQKGVTFTQKEEDVPDGAIVIFSAHGVSPRIRSFFENKDIKIIDATCPLVQKVHDEVIHFVNKGFHVLYIGNPNHDEVKGVVEEAPESITIIQNEDDLSKIDIKMKVVVLTQTTLNAYNTQKLFNKISDRFENVVFPDKDDICFATTSRQQAVKDAAEKCDAFVVIGSQNSSNSKKLQEIAGKLCKKSILIDSPMELKWDWLKGVKNLCVSAGASAPEYLVQDLAKRLREEFGFEQTNG